MKVTMDTIAKKVGVSRNAVSLALRNHPSISDATRKKILQAASDLGYQRNPAYGELMSQMRLKGHGLTQATLALFNANQNPKAFQEHPTIPLYVEGCRRRAGELGYPLDTFWLHESNTDADRWIDILEARGIRGIVMIGFMNQNRIPAHLIPLVEHFPTVVTGVRTRDPALSFSCVDHHILALRAFEKAIELGYNRPGLVLDKTIDNLVEHRFSAGYRCGQEQLPKARQLRPFFDVEAATDNPRLFEKWLDREKPDVIFTLYNIVRHWLNDLGYSVPKDIGLIQLEWRAKHPEWAGMNQHNDITGETAIDMLIGMIHRGESSISEFPRATLIGPTWVDGKTVKHLSKNAAAGRSTQRAVDRK
jgi:LacI family transcriptional regulator